MKPQSRLWFRFGPFRLCPSEGTLLRDDVSIAMSPRTFDTLAFLVKNSPNLVTVDELMAGVWDNVSIEPNNVTQHVFSVRKILGDSSQNPTYIQNIPRRGYRFIAPVESYDEEHRPGPAVRSIRQSRQTATSFVAGRLPCRRCPVRDLPSRLASRATYHRLPPIDPRRQSKRRSAPD